MLFRNQANKKTPFTRWINKKGNDRLSFKLKEDFFKLAALCSTKTFSSEIQQIKLRPFFDTAKESIQKLKKYHKSLVHIRKSDQRCKDLLTSKSELTASVAKTNQLIDTRLSSLLFPMERIEYRKDLIFHIKQQQQRIFGNEIE